MRVKIGQRVAHLAPKRLLGQGGEACVYAWREWAVKIFHDTDPRALAPKLAKLRAFPHDLPEGLLGPRDIVTDLNGHPVGYAMARVPDGEDLKRLGQRRFREGVVPNPSVARLFARLHALLTALHARQVVVGDLNDGNVLFTRGGHDSTAPGGARGAPPGGASAGAAPSLRPWLIDADSIQFGDHPCVVAHPLFVDPALLGVDLAATRAFDANTDWYAFAVLVFASLLYVHPYGGVHPAYPTLLRRAEARHSVLRGDVTRPKAAADPRVLPDELFAWFEAVFDHGRRDHFPLRLLEDPVWTRCDCGAEHARLACPICAARGTARARPPVVVAGGCRAQRIFDGPGRVLAAIGGARLQYLAVDERGRLRREDGAEVATLRVEPGMRFALQGRSTFVGYRDQLLELCDGKLRARHTLTPHGAAPMFDATPERCLALDGDWLVDLAGGERFAALLEGQTWFRCGPRLGYGFFRAGAVTLHFLFLPGRPGFKEIALRPITGRLVDAAVCFDERHALVSLVTEAAGVTETALYLLDAHGALVAHRHGPPESDPLLAPGTRFAMLGGRAVAATEEGLMRVAHDRGLLAPDRTFADTEPFVAGGDNLLPGPGGSVYVVRPREIIHLALTP